VMLDAARLFGAFRLRVPGRRGDANMKGDVCAKAVVIKVRGVSHYVMVQASMPKCMRGK
jgi:hypothetical protein